MWYTDKLLCARIKYTFSKENKGVELCQGIVSGEWVEKEIS